MAVDGGSPALAIRSSVGIELWASSGPKLPYEHKSNLPREETKNSRSITFSPDGRYFAFSNGHEVRILSTSNWQEKCILPRPKAFYLKFSPRGNYLCTWELYVVNKEKPEGSPNMFVYELETGNEVFSIVQKTQTDWEPSWSTDEAIFALVVGGEALFYDLSEGIEGFKSTTRRIGGSRGGALSLGPGNSPPFLAFYIPGAKGAPSMCRLYKYPALSQNQTVAFKSFFQADRVEILWNSRGTGLLLLTSTEVDKSGASYYGNQALHFMATKGDSCAVSLSKEGPVHCVKWSPKAKEFVVVYGYMPSKAALYNLKCDVVFDFGEGPRNCAYFNTFGNLLVLAGFGNLPGNVEIWDVSKREKLANIKCPDTTYFEWNPNGEYFVTATTAPRLRIGNGFKVYHYSGALMHETMWPTGQELLGVEWQKYDEKSFAEPIITKAKQEGIKSSQPEASKKAYTPPHLRLMKEGKNPEKYLPQPKNRMPGMSSSSPAGNAGGQGTGNNHNNGNYRKNNKQNAKACKTKQNKKENGAINDALAATVGGIGIGAEGGIAAMNDINNEVLTGVMVIGMPARSGNANGGDALPAIVYVRNGTEQLHQGHYQQQQSTLQLQQQQQQQQQQQRTMPQRKQQAAAAAATHKKPYQQQHPQQNYQHQHRSQQQQLQQPGQQQSQQNFNTYFDVSGGDVSQVSSKQSFSTDKQPAANLQPQHHQQQQQQPQQQQEQPQQQQQQNSKRAPTSEKEKKIRNIAKKLSDIKKLKLRQEQGETLELNQLHKIEMEEKFLKELRALKLTE